MSPEQLKPSEKTELAIAQSLFEVDAVELNFVKPFTFSSGIKSPVRVNCEELIKSPDEYKRVVNALAETVKSTFFDFNFFCGVIRGGVPFAQELGHEFNKSVVARLGKKQDYQRRNQVFGDITLYDRGLVIEDVLTTAENVIMAAEQMRKEGGTILGVLTIFDYGFRKARDNLLESGLRRWYLTNFNHLLLVGQEIGAFSNPEIKDLKTWWGKINLHC